jgi:hypothetical protein
MELGLVALGAAAVLALVHVITPSLRFLDSERRSVWLSLAGGVSVGYIFVHLLPELAEGRGSSGVGLSIFAERDTYLIALVGLLAFYALDRVVQEGRRRAGGAPKPESESGGEPSPGPGIFWLHMASFGLYNLLVGYLLLHREVMTLRSLAFFTGAMALHFVVTDYGLNQEHQARYRRFGRVTLVAAVTAGYLLGLGTDIPRGVVAGLTAFLGGGVILNVLKEEVPSERRARFWAFALGALGYSALLLTV